MNRLRRRLVMPWVASPKYTRLLALLAGGGAFAVAALMGAAGAAHPHPGWTHAFVLTLGFAIWALWSSYVATNLQLARDARDLCLPRIARDADLSVLLFAALTLAGPMLVCLALGVPEIPATAVFVTAAAIGLAYMLLPVYIGLPLVLAVFVLVSSYRLAVPVQAWCAMVAALLAFDVWRWRSLRRAREVQREGLNAAAVFACYRREAVRDGNWGHFSRSFLLSRPAAPEDIDLHGVGPVRATHALRIAFGGIGAPKLPLSRLREIGRFLAFVLLFGSVLWVPLLLDPRLRTESADAIRIHWISPALVYCGMLACCVAVSAFAGRCRALWRKPDAELPLLALLPGLGSRASAKRRAVIALLAPALLMMAIAAVVLCAGAIGIHAHFPGYLSIALCCGGTMALILAIALASMAGTPVHTAGYVLLYLGLLVLSMLTFICALPNDQHHDPHPGSVGVTLVGLLILWCFYLAIVVVIAVRGWHALRKRPHVFLAHAP